MRPGRTVNRFVATYLSRSSGRCPSSSIVVAIIWSAVEEEERSRVLAVVVDGADPSLATIGAPPKDRALPQKLARSSSRRRGAAEGMVEESLMVDEK